MVVNRHNLSKDSTRSNKQFREQADDTHLA